MGEAAHDSKRRVPVPALGFRLARSRFPRSFMLTLHLYASIVISHHSDGPRWVLKDLSPAQMHGWWHVVDVDYCMFGAEYRKSTRILTSQPVNFALAEGDDGWLTALGRRCDRQHEHVTLSGWGPRGSRMRPTRGTARGRAHS